MTYKERSRFENRKKYRRADVLNTVIMMASILAVMIGGASFDIAFTPAAISMAAGLLGIACEARMMEGDDD